ncbi:MAG: phosphotransferase family protein [Proteobacteria bacterium]|nr:phosphotransferase family protein [Pseudomonadota bacterium]
MGAPLPHGLEAALAAFDAGRDALAAGIRAEPLAGGSSNRTFRVRSAAGDWAVRLGGADDAAFGINRIAERQVHAAAAAAGFAPAIVHAAPATGVLVTQFVAGEVPTRESLRTEPGLQQLGARLAELHALPPPRAVRRLDVHDVLAHYLELAPAAPGPVPRELIGARLRWSLANYQPSPPALCHNDLHWRNLIAGAQLWFVDWEYGGVGDPLFELAAICGYHDLEAGQRDVLLAAYGGPAAAEPLEAMCRVFDCLHALWLDAARAWETLESERRAALVARIAFDPAERDR